MGRYTDICPTLFSELLRFRSNASCPSLPAVRAAQERGMKPSIVILPVLLALSSFSYAQDKTIYKCADSKGIGYRDTPCATQQEQTPITSARKVNWQSENAKAIQPTDARLAATPFFASRLFIGMTDTQVLNLPSWVARRKSFEVRRGTFGASSGSTRTGAQETSEDFCISKMRGWSTRRMRRRRLRSRHERQSNESTASRGGKRSR
jgi:hypothetical protein